MAIHNNPIFYAIIPSDFVDSVDYTQMLCTRNGVRFSVDESKCLVKWVGEIIPSSILAIDNYEGPYTMNQILEIVAGIDWELLDS